LQVNGKIVTTAQKPIRQQHLITSTYHIELTEGTSQFVIQLASGAETAGVMVTLISDGNETIRVR
jgi:hypothetical protein